MLRDVISNKISQSEYTALVNAGALTPSLIEEQIWLDFNFTMETQKNCENLKPVAMSGSYNDLTDKPEIPTPVTVVNALDSTSETDALSAYQGNVLNQNIETLSDNLQTLNDNYTELSKDVTTLSNDLTTLSQKVDDIPTVEVINNLTSDSTTAALSAAQGKELKSLIDSLNIPTITPKCYLYNVSLNFLSSDARTSIAGNFIMMLNEKDATIGESITDEAAINWFINWLTNDSSLGDSYSCLLAGFDNGEQKTVTGLTAMSGAILCFSTMGTFDITPALTISGTPASTMKIEYKGYTLQ